MLSKIPHGSIIASRHSDILAIHDWLNDEATRCVDGNFLCNWKLIQSNHEQGELLVYVDPNSDAPVAFQLGKLVGSGILQVKEDFRGRGIGKAIVDHCIDLASEQREFALAIECNPASSIPFWKKMGFRVLPDSNPPNRAFRVLKNQLPLPKDGEPTMIQIRFYPQERIEKNNSAPPYESSADVEGKLLSDGRIHLRNRVVHHNFLNIDHRDTIIEIEHRGQIVFCEKAKRKESNSWGVNSCRYGWYLEHVQLH